MSLLDEFTRVTKRLRCGACGAPDWCLVRVTADGDVAASICPRTPSTTRWGAAGYLHVHDPRAAGHLQRGRTYEAEIEVVTGGGPFADRARRAQVRLARSNRIVFIAADLGVSATALQRLGAGLEYEHLTFPMRAADGAVIGIRRRSSTGKGSATGSKNALFIPSDLGTGGRLLVAEGPTDTAALLSIGLEAVGRPNCNGGVPYVANLMRRHRPAQVVVVADADGPGMDGAQHLAAVLRTLVNDVVVIAPPTEVGDVRGWVQAGARDRDVLELVHAAPRWSVEISGGRR